MTLLNSNQLKFKAGKGSGLGGGVVWRGDPEGAEGVRPNFGTNCFEKFFLSQMRFFCNILGGVPNFRKIFYLRHRFAQKSNWTLDAWDTGCLGHSFCCLFKFDGFDPQSPKSNTS